MHDLHVHLASFGNLDGFRERRYHVVRFIAQMGEVAGVVSLQHPAKRDHLFRLRIRSGSGEQAGGEPQRARIKGLSEQTNHCVELTRAGLPLLHSHDHQTQRVVADEHAGVHGDGREAVEILGECRLLKGQPWRARAQIVAQ